MVSIDTKVGVSPVGPGGRECGRLCRAPTENRRRCSDADRMSAALQAFGQTSANGSIRGYVRDATGGVLPDTTITVAGPAAPAPFTVSRGSGSVITAPRFLYG